MALNMDTKSIAPIKNILLLHILWMCHNIFDHFLIIGHLSGFQGFAVVVHQFDLPSLRMVSRIGTPGSKDMNIFHVKWPNGFPQCIHLYLEGLLDRLHI